MKAKCIKTKLMKMFRGYTMLKQAITCNCVIVHVKYSEINVRAYCKGFNVETFKYNVGSMA